MDGDRPGTGSIDMKLPTQSFLFDDGSDDIFLQLKERFAVSRNDIMRLQARVLDLEHENGQLKAEMAALSVSKGTDLELMRENEELKLRLAEREADLKDTEAFLCALTANKRPDQVNSFIPTKPLAQQMPSSKRARSPSVGTHEAEQPTPKKSKFDFAPASTLSTLEVQLGRLAVVRRTRSSSMGAHEPDQPTLEQFKQGSRAAAARHGNRTNYLTNLTKFDAICFTGQLQPSSVTPVFSLSESMAASRPNRAAGFLAAEMIHGLRDYESEDIMMDVDGNPGAPVPVRQTTYSNPRSIAASASSHLNTGFPSQAVLPPPATPLTFSTVKVDSALISQLPPLIGTGSPSPLKASSTSLPAVERLPAPPRVVSTSVLKPTSPLSSPPFNSPEEKEAAKDKNAAATSPVTTEQTRLNAQCQPQPHKAGESAGLVPPPLATEQVGANAHCQQRLQNAGQQAPAAPPPPLPAGAAAAAARTSSPSMASPSPSSTRSSGIKTSQPQTAPTASASATSASGVSSAAQPHASSMSAMQVDKQAVVPALVTLPASSVASPSPLPAVSSAPKVLQPQATVISLAPAALTPVIPSGAQSCSFASTSAMQVDKQAIIPAPAPVPSLSVVSASPTGTFVSGTLQIKAAVCVTYPSATSSQSMPSPANKAVKIEQDVAVPVGKSPKQPSSTTKTTITTNDRLLNAGASSPHAAPSATPPSLIVQATLNSNSQTRAVLPTSGVAISTGTAFESLSAAAPAPASASNPDANVRSGKVGSAPIGSVAPTSTSTSLPGQRQMQTKSHGLTSQVKVKEEPTSPSAQKSLALAGATTASPTLTASKLSTAPSTSSTAATPGGKSDVASQKTGAISTAISNSVSSSSSGHLQPQAQAQSSGSTALQAQQANSSARKISATTPAGTGPTSAAPKLSTAVSTSLPSPNTNVTSAAQMVKAAPAPAATPNLSTSTSIPGHSEAQAQAQLHGTKSQVPEGKTSASANQVQSKAPAGAAITKTATTTSSSTPIHEQRKQATLSGSSTTPRFPTKAAAVFAANVNITSQNVGPTTLAALISASVEGNPMQSQTPVRADGSSPETQGKTSTSAREAKGSTVAAAATSISTASISDRIKKVVMLSKSVTDQICSRPPENRSATSTGVVTSCSNTPASVSSSTAETAKLAASQLPSGSNPASVGNKPSQSATLTGTPAVSGKFPATSVSLIEPPIQNASGGTAHAQTFIGRSQSTRPSNSPFKRIVPVSTPPIPVVSPSGNPTLLADMKKHYLGSALTISPTPHDLQIPRSFLRLAYGGSDQQWVQFIAPDRNPSGPVVRRLVFPKVELNPAMPTAPGSPGLIFSSRHEILFEPPWSVFHKISPTSKKKGPTVWKYLGDYECVLCGRMSAEAFRALTDEVKRQWAQALLDTKRFEVYVGMRARIALRLAGLIPVKDATGDEKANEEEVVKDEIKAIQRGNGRYVREEDIIVALSRGDEAIDIIRLTCVKYDHVFADHMKDKYATYPTMLAEYDQKKASGEIKAKASRSKGKKSAASAASRQSTRKRTAATPKSDEDEDDGEDELEHRGGPHDDFVMPGVQAGSNDIEMRGPLITIPPRPRRSTRTDYSLLLEIEGSDDFDEPDW